MINIQLNNKEKLLEGWRPGGCHDCELTPGQEFCLELSDSYSDIAKYVKLKTFHPKCPYKKEWEMYVKLRQL